jgi:hypothetical protein
MVRVPTHGLQNYNRGHLHFKAKGFSPLVMNRRIPPM